MASWIAQHLQSLPAWQFSQLLFVLGWVISTAHEITTTLPHALTHQTTPRLAYWTTPKVSSQTLLRWDPERSESRALPDPFASVPGFKILPVEPLQAQSLYLVVSSQAARSPMWDGL